MISHQEKLRNELAGLKVSIAHYRSLLEEAEQREATIQAALDAYIFPVLTLPPEITTEIFLHYAFAVYKKDEREPRLPCKDILILTMVCRAWRHLALSAHGLWSTIDLGNFPLSYKARGEMEDIVDGWFSRAGAIPLSLRGWMGPVKKKTSRGINTILRRHAPRLRDLHICVSDPGHISNFVDDLSFPILQSLDLSNLADGGPGTPSLPPLPISTFRESPQLRHLNLEAIPPASLGGIRWERLESLATLDITPQECLDILHKSPALLKWESYGSDENFYDADQAMISHPRLATFELLNSNREMLRYLTLPALRDLSVHLQELDDDDFLAFLSRSRRALQRFAFFGRGPLVLSMKWCQHMMHLTSLGLSELRAPFRANFVRGINRQHEHNFLPALEELTLRDWKSDQLDAQLLDALHSRSTAQEAESGKAVPMQLKLFRFIWMSEGPYTADAAGIESLIRDHQVVLRDLKMRGMEVYVGTEERNYFE